MKPFVLVNFPDKPRKIRYGTNALIELKDLLDVSLEEIGNVGGLESLAAMRALLYVGIKYGEDDPNITLNGAGDLIDDYEGGQEELTGKIFEAFSSAFPQGNAKGSVAKKKKIPGTGTT